MEKFAERGIEVGRWFSQPVSSNNRDMSSYGYKNGTCPNAEFIAAHIVNLPLHNRMSKNDIKVVVDCLDMYLRDHHEEYICID
jgi:dTDP-4-amino-4,6-dideoxygalactose transaminase